MKSSCRNHIKKQLETQRLFLDFWCQMGAQNDLKIWVFFALGDHWDTLWLWNDPGGTQEQILLQNMPLFIIFYQMFDWFPADFWMMFLKLWWNKIDSVTHGRWPSKPQANHLSFPNAQKHRGAAVSRQRSQYIYIYIYNSYIVSNINPTYSVSYINPHTFPIWITSIY